MRGAAALLTLAPSLALGQELAAKPSAQNAPGSQRARPAQVVPPLAANVRGAFQEFAGGKPLRAYQQASRVLQSSRAGDLGDAHWVAGLAAWRLERFDVAAAHFAARAAMTKGATPHQLSAAAFWLARSYLYGRKPELVDTWLKRAAMHDGTFYGAIAARQLARARSASLPALHVPKLRPNGGWRLDRALIFAVMRQESAFNSAAVSSAGAVGLMQVMPETATALAGDGRYQGDGYRRLFDTGTNMALGQRFLELMLGPEHFNGNIVLAIAAYNAGPKSVAAWSYRDDPLSFIEAIPYEETRQYVPRVLVNFWLYRRQMNQAATSLDALASNEWPVYRAADLAEAARRAEVAPSRRRLRHRSK